MGRPRVIKLPASPTQQAPVLRKALFRAADFLGISRDELAVILGTTTATLSRYSNEDGMFGHKTKSWEISAHIVRAARGLSAILGGQEIECQKWMRAELRPINQAPVEAMKTIEGLVNVLHYLDSMRGKI